MTQDSRREWDACRFIEIQSREVAEMRTLIRDLLAALDRDHIDSGSVAQLALKEMVREEKA